MEALGAVSTGLTILLVIVGGLGAVLYGNTKNLRAARDDANSLAETRGERIADLEAERTRDKEALAKAHTDVLLLRDMAQGVPKLDQILVVVERIDARLEDRA